MRKSPAHKSSEAFIYESLDHSLIKAGLQVEFFVCSVKVTGAHFDFCDVERCDVRGFDVNHPILILERTFDQKEPGTWNDEVVALEHVGSEDALTPLRPLPHHRI